MVAVRRLEKREVEKMGGGGSDSDNDDDAGVKNLSR